MKKEWEQEIELRHLVDMLRIAFNANEQVAIKMATHSDFMQGMQSGMNIANNDYRRYIERLEKLVKEMYPESYMVEDVNLSGAEEIA